jgi:hypothetical protein
VPAVVLAVLRARLEIAALIALGVGTAYLCGLVAPSREHLPGRFPSRTE